MQPSNHLCPYITSLIQASLHIVMMVKYNVQMNVESHLQSAILNMFLLHPWM